MLWVWYPNQSHSAIDFAPGIHLLQETRIYYTITSNDSTPAVLTKASEQMNFFFKYHFHEYISLNFEFQMSVVFSVIP